MNEAITPFPAAERWEHERELAEGGMGVVHQAFDRVLERRCALKTLRGDLAGLTDIERSFIQEARIAGRLQHPGVVPVYELGYDDACGHYFTMKLVRGRTLAEHIYEDTVRPRSPVRLYELLDVFVRVCDALAFAHDRGVVHCDVKPENIMVGDFGEVYLMDWGIARVLHNDVWVTHSVSGEAQPERFTESGEHRAARGTLAYMAPEQALWRPSDERADIYSLGVVLYEIMAQQHPFPYRTQAEVLKKVRAGQFAPPSEVAGLLWTPPDLERIVLRAMSLNPKRRYRSVSDLRDEVVRFLHGAADFPVIEYAADQLIVRAGDSGDAAFVVARGKVGVFAEAGGRRVLLRTLREGEVFGEIALLSDSKRTATVIALEPTACYVITAEVLGGEVQSLKPWMGVVLKTLSDRFREALQQRMRRYGRQPILTVVRHSLMYLTTWGERGASGHPEVRWSALAAEIERMYDTLPEDLAETLEETGGFRLDLETDRAALVDPATVRELLRSGLEADAPAVGPR
jgi:CRP-like cAMP-binding protein